MQTVKYYSYLCVCVRVCASEPKEERELLNVVSAENPLCPLGFNRKPCHHNNSGLQQKQASGVMVPHTYTQTQTFSCTQMYLDGCCLAQLRFITVYPSFYHRSHKTSTRRNWRVATAFAVDIWFIRYLVCHFGHLHFRVLTLALSMHLSKKRADLWHNISHF